MYVKQLYTGCLSEATYCIESKGEMAFIDPLRETTPYLALAQERNAQIKYIFLTHFHADFVSGHVDLAKATDATIVFGPNASPDFDFHSGKDNEIFTIGDLQFKLLHTPGHTMESSTYLLIDENQKEHCIFTGDTLFIGDVGRPDLAVKSDVTQENLAGNLYDSLREKIMTLPDDVIVYPAHGAGSACGKNLSDKTFDTLGNQKRNNYALRADMTKAEFIKEVTTGLKAPPPYFPKNVMMNQHVNKSYDAIIKQGVKPLSVETFKTLTKEKKALILDVRSTDEFIKAHIPNATFIGLDGGFAPWVGALIEDLNQPILLLVPEGRAEEAVTRLARVGYDNALGFLEGGIAAWIKAGNATESISSISTADFVNTFTEKDHLIDVRKPSEFETAHITHSHIQNTPLDHLHSNFKEITLDQPYYLHCAGGYRSVIAISLLKQKGYHQLTNVEGGFEAIKRTNLLAIKEKGCSNVTS